MKKLLLFTLASLTLTACSNNDTMYTCSQTTGSLSCGERETEAMPYKSHQAERLGQRYPVKYKKTFKF